MVTARVWRTSVTKMKNPKEQKYIFFNSDTFFSKSISFGQTDQDLYSVVRSNISIP
jgi:hypothetical protein